MPDRGKRMKYFKFDWEKIIENRFNHLLVIILLLFFFSPFLQTEDASGFLPIAPFIYTVAIIAILKTIFKKKNHFYILAGLELGSFLLEILLHHHVIPFYTQFFYFLSYFVRIAFILLFVIHLTYDLFASKKVTGDTVKGGICAYILLGVLWAPIYKVVYTSNPLAFSGGLNEHFSFFYFSFTTLTTLGYGDIIPVTSFAKMLTNLEAITGQMFLVIFMARLVGLHIAHQKIQDQ